jgi:hypothetical protein
VINNEKCIVGYKEDEIREALNKWKKIMKYLKIELINYTQN